MSDVVVSRWESANVTLTPKRHYVVGRSGTPSVHPGRITNPSYTVNNPSYTVNNPSYTVNNPSYTVNNPG